MANTSFYKYLEAAFRYKVYNPKGQTATPDTHFSSFGYNLAYKDIFRYARKVLPTFYRDLAEFPNTEEGNLQLAKKVLEKLDKHQDIELETQFESITASPENEQIIAQAQAESQQTETPQAAGAASGTPFSGMGLPSAPPISSSPRVARIIHEAPQTPKPEPAIANKSGMVTGMRDIKSPSWLKTFGSNAQIFTKRNLERIGKGIFGAAKTGLETANPFLGRMGNGLVNGLTSIANPGGMGGVGSRSIFGRFSRGGGRTEFSVGKTVKGSGGLIFAVSIIGFMILVGGLAITGASTPGETAPIPTAPPYQPGAGKGIISCPLNGGRITVGSKATPGGHCSTGYQTDYPCPDPDTTGRATAVDIASTDRIVYLPQLNNADVVWTIGDVDTNTDYVNSAGVTINGRYSIRASAQSQGKTYDIRFVHILSTNLSPGQKVLSKTPVGSYRVIEDHTHITISEDGEFKPGDLYFNLCQ